MLYDLNLKIPKNKITAIIGPSGCGKSTFLRQINRMNEEMAKINASGNIFIESNDMLDPKNDVMKLRSQVGMIFQNLNHFQDPSMIISHLVQNYTELPRNLN